MAVEKIVIVDTDSSQNPHYTSLNAAIIGESGGSPIIVTSSDLVANDEQLTIECRASSGAADIANVVLAGFTTDATRLVKIRSLGNHRHNGVWDETKYRLERQSGSAKDLMLISSVKDFIIEGIQFHQLRPSEHNSGAIHISNTNISWNGKIDSCIIRNTYVSDGSQAMAINCYECASGSFLELINTIIYDFPSSTQYDGLGVGLGRSGWTVYCYNSTAYNCREGFFRYNGVLYCHNCISMECTTQDFTNASSSSSHNLSSDGTAPGSNSLINQVSTDVFVDHVNRDFRLKKTSEETSPAIDAGTDLSANMEAVDIANTPRPQGLAWDIGAFEYVDVSGAPMPIQFTAIGQPGSVKWSWKRG